MRLHRFTAALLLAALAASSCSQPDYGTGPTASATASPAASLATALLRRLPCPANRAHTVRGVVGPAGGELRVAGFAVAFPAGAVRADQTFELSVLPGNFIEIEAHAVGHARYEFAAPVAVTLNLADCGTLPKGLRAYHLDGATKTLLENMGGRADLVGRTLRFTTPHFSGYTVVWASEPAPADSTGAATESTGG